MISIPGHPVNAQQLRHYANAMAPVRTEGSASPAVGEIFPIIRGAAPQMWSLIDNNPPPTLLSLIKANH